MPLTERGVLRGELFADTLYVMNDQTRFDFIKGLVKFNTKTGAPNGEMRADSGRYDQRTQILEGWGNVEVTTTDGRRLRSPHVTYNQLRNELSSDTTFTLSAGDRTARGIGFTADPNFTRYQCRRNCGGSANVVLPSR
jgi:LPS export ABC transporter protein LptC